MASIEKPRTTDAPCPSCGRPLPILLRRGASFQCEACGYRGSVGVDLASQLAGVRGAVEGSDLAARQLSASIRLLAALDSRRYWVAFLWALVAVPFGGALVAATAELVASYGADTPEARRAAFVAPALALPGLVHIACGIGILRLVRGVRRDALASLWARPAVGSAGLACRVCGAPLEVGVRGVVRCAHCASDNLVAPRVVAQALAAEVAAYESEATGAVKRVDNRWLSRHPALILALLGASLFASWASFLLAQRVIERRSLARSPASSLDGYRWALVRSSEHEDDAPLVDHCIVRQTGKNPQTGFVRVRVRRDIDRGLDIEEVAPEDIAPVSPENALSQPHLTTRSWWGRDDRPIAGRVVSLQADEWGNVFAWLGEGRREVPLDALCKPTVFLRPRVGCVASPILPNASDDVRWVEQLLMRPRWGRWGLACALATLPLEHGLEALTPRSAALQRVALSPERSSDITLTLGFRADSGPSWDRVVEALAPLEYASVGAASPAPRRLELPRSVTYGASGPFARLRAQLDARERVTELVVEWR